MNILLTGAVEGHLSNLFNKATSVKADWIVSTGDLGIWPDPARMDRAAKKHASKEFSLRYVGINNSPEAVPTLFVAGVHDDHKFLKHRVLSKNFEVLPDVYFLSQGYKTEIGEEFPCRVTGLGKVYSETTYNDQYNKRSYRHYTRRDVERACSSGPTDLLVLHEYLDASGIRNVIYATRPKLIAVAKHPNRKQYTNVQNIPVITLDRRETVLTIWRDSSFIY